MNKHYLKQNTVEQKAFKKLCKQDFACEPDAMQALETFKKTLKITTVDLLKLEKSPHYNSKGCPKKGQKPVYL